MGLEVFAENNAVEIEWAFRIEPDTIYRLEVINAAFGDAYDGDFVEINGVRYVLGVWVHQWMSLKMGDQRALRD